LTKAKTAKTSQGYNKPKTRPRNHKTRQTQYKTRQDTTKQSMITQNKTARASRFTASDAKNKARAKAGAGLGLGLSVKGFRIKGEDQV
jgi:hypothetical protein